MYFESLIFVLTNSNSIILLCVLRHFFHALLLINDYFFPQFSYQFFNVKYHHGVFISETLFGAVLESPFGSCVCSSWCLFNRSPAFQATSVPWGAGRLCHMFLPNPATPSLLFILPSFTPFLTAFLSLHRFKFLTCIIFLLSKKPLLTFRVKCVYWWQVPSIFD